MTDSQALLTRLDEIGQSLERSGQGLALIGLGSVGLELDRLDAYSDLDFFAIVEAGYKPRYLENLDWLSSVCPVAYTFRNTVDGYKLLFEDGIFCEFAVFEQAELSAIPFAPGRVVWKRPEVDDMIAIPAATSAPPKPPTVDWLVGEVVTNLYVGLGRYRRGEKLSAQRFIQHYAVDRVLELAAFVETETAAHKDAFAGERRFEARYPVSAKLLPGFVQGYERSPESALAILEFIGQHWAVNPALAGRIRELCQTIA